MTYKRLLSILIPPRIRFPHEFVPGRRILLREVIG